MIRTGRLKIDANESRLAGTLLALLGTDDPKGAATKFVRKRGFVEGDRITVTGESGAIGEPPGVAVLYITDVQPAPDISMAGKETKSMTRTGILRIIGKESRVAGTLLARCGTENPSSNATKFVKKRGFVDGDKVKATGESGTIGEPPGVPVLCVTSVESA